jgi:hypothetical protein
MLSSFKTLLWFGGMGVILEGNIIKLMLLHFPGALRYTDEHNYMKLIEQKFKFTR